MWDKFNKVVHDGNCQSLKVIGSLEAFSDRLTLLVLSDYTNTSHLMPLSSWKTQNENKKQLFFLNMYNGLVNINLCNGIGPINLAMVYRYVNFVREKLKVNTRVIHCVHNANQQTLDTAVFLICAFLIIDEDFTACQLYQKIAKQFVNKRLSIPLQEMSSYQLCSFNTVVVDECINAFYKAKWYGFFDFDDFNVLEWEKYESIDSGNIKWILPGRLLTFPSPNNVERVDQYGYQLHSPSFYYHYFNKRNVRHVVRLASIKMYEPRYTFVDEANIQHTDITVSDSQPPTMTMLNDFLHLCEQHIDCLGEVIRKVGESQSDFLFGCGGAVATSCLAAYEKSGCLIAAYIVKHWPFTAAEAMAWVRLCRPESINAAQCQWLRDYEDYLKESGKLWRKDRHTSENTYLYFANGLYSIKQDTVENLCGFKPPIPLLSQEKILVDSCYIVSNSGTAGLISIE